MRVRETKSRAGGREVPAPIIARYLVSGLALGLLGAVVLTFSWSAPRALYKQLSPFAVMTALGRFRRPIQRWLGGPEEPPRSYGATSIGVTLIGFAMGALPIFLVTGEAARTGDMLVLCALIGVGCIVYGLRARARGE